ncbi:nicotinate-nucleotide diphosphorylase (carboxylating) [Haloterrigena sp. SYSU A558-1]|uniref:Nicotinate-nucleotide diphosphorylase (Carboxylating) n=1 Tax=Haloterrigena gelatinilytica TaxID=2741724 RepID=A0ABX2LB81_9EURY|nr:nicotinate-nucleotide diphosphorylase (carboxylating) [Haloterrigena gelatinilytica]NUC73527.1 nicotinate-nucleotide diphosphorylase (carboxylating) [Haloterrigena gelatinilytica]
MITNAQVERWLREDVGHHDVTNQVPGETTGRLVAKEPGIAAGLEAATAVFDYLGVAVDEALENGTAVDPGDELLRVEGAAREVLRGERVAVNLAGHASGIATRTNEAVERAREAQRVRESQSDSRSPSEVQSTSEDASDTRAATGELGLEGAIEHFRERTSFATKLDVEVEAVDDAPRAAAAGADIVLLDNMSPAETKKAVDLLADYDALAEASGGITLETVADYAATGVDVVSMGSLTHSAPSLDLSFRTGD